MFKTDYEIANQFTVTNDLIKIARLPKIPTPPRTIYNVHGMVRLPKDEVPVGVKAPEITFTRSKHETT